MAPRKQVKQAAAKSTLAAANGNVTSPKKKKTTAKSAEEANIKAAPGKTRVKALQETAVFSPKMLRSKVKNVAEPTKTAVPKTDAAGISKGKAVANKRQRVNNNIAEEEEEEEVVEKKKRGKTAIKDTKSKTTAKAPVARKRKSETEDQVKDPAQNGEVIHEENPPVAKRATRAKTGEEKNVTPATTKRAKVVQKPPAKKSRNVETKVPAETDDVASKKPRKGMKKTAKVTAKERSPKNLQKQSLHYQKRKKQITKEQNEEDAIEGDKLKTNMKNSKKAIFKGKRNVETKENSDVQEKEAVIPEVEENGGGEIPQIVESKQKKKNTGKASAAMNEKIEVKKREKKRQTVVTSINEKQETKDIVEKDETTRTMNLTFDSLDEINISPKDISLNNDNNSQEENNEVESTETVKDTQKIKIEFPNNELQRSSSFLRFD
ncbi:LOW QUALITY PROTEIN: PC4 and SFRS1-interacting protein-like [Nylanderia fulva]|uniref:LOW QUALITY PROTEIN: PC4 and SFRS1-interacting protein-like n=1 Tax=Nylanderia fulva TaxID=613905 RepID=UPI0010FB3814|nr:LOW QUALITY PROTEIN: PC4 and SFRS1-interacting protein-like [Nylanderia fulva]